MNNITHESEFIEFADELDRKIKKLSSRMMDSSWRRYLEKNYEDPDKIRREQAEIFLNYSYKELIEEWLEKTENLRLQRILQLMRRLFLKAQVTLDPEVFILENSLHELIVGHQKDLDQRRLSRSALQECVRSDPNRTNRESAWRTIYEMSDKLETNLMELVRLRNIKSVKNEFPDYPRFSLFIDQISQEKIELVFKEVLNATAGDWKEFLEECRSAMGIKNISPWDVEYYIESVLNPYDDDDFPQDKIIPLFEDFLKKFHVELKELPIRVDIHDIPFGGISLIVDPGRDIRIIANPRNGYEWYRILFHEFGRALHGALIKEPSYVIATGDPEFFFEGMAGIFESFCLEPDWLKETWGFKGAELDNLMKSRRFSRYYHMRQYITLALFELNLYQREPKNPNELFRELHKQYLGVDIPQGSFWAANPVYISYPIYVQNYVVAAAITAQVRSALLEKFGSLFHYGNLEFLKENFFTAGGRVHWRKKIEDATNRPLASDDLIAELKL